MRTADFDYVLPPDRIAQVPAAPRDAARLMVIERSSGAIGHRHVRDLPELLAPADLLVANDSRVIPARLQGRKATGGRVEVLLLRSRGDGSWTALVRGRVRVGTELVFGNGGAGEEARAEVVDIGAHGVRRLRFDREVEDLLERIGRVPLPPYITAPLDDPERYQTVYGRAAGSAAAPTAGLHFTPGLLDALRDRGIGWATVTLHVGLDTFRPVEVERPAAHPIHREWMAVEPAAARAVDRAAAGGGRVVAVGTTTVRALESAAMGAPAGARVAPREGWTDLFILPGHPFRAVDALLTNFHLPRSSLLMLVSAFAGKALIDRAYAEAIDRGYRFYSFGDAMLIL